MTEREFYTETLDSLTLRKIRSLYKFCFDDIEAYRAELKIAESYEAFRVCKALKQLIDDENYLKRKVS